MGIPEGKAGTVETLKVMRGLVRNYKKSLPIRNIALSVIQHLNGKDYGGELQALQNYVRNRIRYVRDIRGVETIQTPEATLQIGQGDCDDQSVLLASLLESIGHPTRFVAIGFAPDQFDHVFVESRLGAGWISAETTEPVGLGWQPPNVQARLFIHN